jgi:protein-S-isoprenylcysteine O-methyltransferase Ste14
MYRIPPGPAIFPMNWIINGLKGLTGIYLFAIMLYYDNFSRGAWIYWCVHGSYGIFWILKDVIFPDNKFGVNITLFSASLPISVMYIYLIPGYRMLSQHSMDDPSLERIILCLVTYFMGIFLMTCSDLQKYYTCKYNPGLIKTGFFKMTRNPNYLGEIFIYNSFAIIVGRMEFWVILFFAYTIVFGVRMTIKDLSLSKKKGWKDYDSYMLLPKFSSCWLDNLIIYSSMILLGVSIYVSGGFVAWSQDLYYALVHTDASKFCEKFHNSDLYPYIEQIQDQAACLIEKLTQK